MPPDPGRVEAERIVRALGALALGTAERKRLETRLVELYQSNPSSREVVLRAFHKLALNLAARYFRGREPLEDLEQVALLGLVGALRRFDVSRESPFIAYAIPTIAGELRRHYRDTGWAVHVARGAQETAQKVLSLDRAGGRPATTAEAAQQLGMSEADVAEGRRAARAMLADSLDSPIRDREDGGRLASLARVDDGGFRAAEDRVWLETLMGDLPERQCEILRLRFGEDLTQSEIGDRLGISQVQVSRLLQRSLDRMRMKASRTPLEGH